MAFRYFLPAVAWGLVILIAISMPPGNIPKSGIFSIPHFDKFVHFALFTVFGLLFSFGFFKQSKQGVFHLRFVFFTVLAGVIYGSLTEILQHFYFTGRDGNIIDVLFNLFGTVFGVTLFSFILRIRPGFLK